MTSPKTLSPGTPNVTLTGLIDAYGSIGVYEVNGNPTTIDAAIIGHSPTHFTVHNTGTILSSGTTEYDGGIVLGASGTVFNTGTIIAGTGIAIFGTTGKSSVSNTGDIVGSLGVGLFAFDTASVTNSKNIYGHADGVELAAGGVVTNAAKATIASGTAVAIAAKLAATITNAGTLRGEYGGIFLQAGGKVTNSGLILQTNSNSAGGALESYQAASVTNTGHIEGGNGIKFEVSSPTSTIFVTNSGTIDVISTVAQNSFWFDGFLGYGVGVYSTNAGEVVNSKLIEGNHIGVAFEHAAGTVINSGTISAAVGYGVYLNAGGTVSNTGTIYGFDQGMFDGPGAVADFITNSGYIAAKEQPFAFPSGNTYIGGGIVAFGAGTVINTGTVSDPGGGAVQLLAFSNANPLPATITNSGLIQGLYGVQFYGAGGINNTGSIIAKDDGVFISSPAGELTNSGTIEATGTTFNYSTIAANTYTAAGIRLKSGGTITNAATGHISALGGDAIHGYGQPTTVINDGSITATKVGIFLSAGGSVQNAGTIQSGASAIYNFGTGLLSVYNAKTGRITGAHNGVTDSGTAGTLINDGIIIATDTTFTNSAGTVVPSHGVLFENGGTITNASTGTIIGAVGIAIDGNADGFVDNAGHVTSTSRAGIYLQLVGTVINAATGTIDSGRAGIDLYGSGFVSNAGLIDAGHSGLYLKYGGTAVNTGNISAALSGVYALNIATISNSGTIRGGTDGIDLTKGGTIIDTGTIEGAAFAISFATGNANLLVIDAAANITGSIDGGNGILELAADGKVVGSVSTARQAQFANFGSIEIDTGAIWDFTGKFTFNTPTALLNDGTLKESAADTLTIDSALTGTGFVDLSKKPLTLNGSVASTQKIAFTGTAESLDLGDPGSFNASIEKFALGDTIDLTGITLSAITATHFAAGVLTLDEGAIALEFTFANPSTFTGDTFKLKADGHGTAITLSHAAAALLPVPPATLSPLPTLS